MAKRFYLPEKVCKMCNIGEDSDIAIQNIDSEKDLITFKVLRGAKEPKAKKGGIENGRERTDALDEKSRSDKRENDISPRKIPWLK